MFTKRLVLTVIIKKTVLEELYGWGITRKNEKDKIIIINENIIMEFGDPHPKTFLAQIN